MKVRVRDTLLHHSDSGSLLILILLGSYRVSCKCRVPPAYEGHLTLQASGVEMEHPEQSSCTVKHPLSSPLGAGIQTTGAGGGGCLEEGVWSFNRGPRRES